MCVRAVGSRLRQVKCLDCDWVRTCVYVCSSCAVSLSSCEVRDVPRYLRTAYGYHVVARFKVKLVSAFSVTTRSQLQQKVSTDIYQVHVMSMLACSCMCVQRRCAHVGRLLYLVPYPSSATPNVRPRNHTWLWCVSLGLHASEIVM